MSNKSKLAWNKFVVLRPLSQALTSMSMEIRLKIKINMFRITIVVSVMQVLCNISKMHLSESNSLFYIHLHTAMDYIQTDNNIDQ